MMARMTVKEMGSVMNDAGDDAGRALVACCPWSINPKQAWSAMPRHQGQKRAPKGVAMKAIMIMLMKMTRMTTKHNFTVTNGGLSKALDHRKTGQQ